MHFIFHNPHINPMFGSTFLDYLLRSNSGQKMQKYKYLLDFMAEKKINIGIYTDFKESSLPVMLRNKFFIRFEIHCWLIIKGFNPFGIKLISNPNDLSENDIILFSTFNALDNESFKASEFYGIKSIKIAHFTHYFYSTSVIAKNIKRAGIDFIISENNLQSGSDYFRYFFGEVYVKPVYHLPFTFGTRFTTCKSFNDRLNKAISIGAVFKFSDHNVSGSLDGIINFYKISDSLHLIRNVLYQESNSIKKEIDIGNQVIRPLLLGNNGFFSRFIGRLKMIFFGIKYEYFNFNMTDRLNEYKMFICGEEIVGVPGIGFVEGMACGCAYIGKNDSMYTDLGMIPGVHYIAHNGTLEDIIQKIQYYQEHNDELEKIAMNGYKFVQEKLSGEKVAATFYKDLMTLATNYKNNGFDKDKTVFNCSFTQKNVIST